MAEVVYVLCALTSIACAAMLLRAYAATRHRILLLSGWCFVGLAINNLLLFIDLVVYPSTDLSILRSVIALAAVTTLLAGLIWENG
jgi:hydrogenase/urease accessory protein HupE